LRLTKGCNGFTDYNEENIKNPDILALARKVNYAVDDDFTRLPIKTGPARVTIKLKNGNVYKKQVDAAKGTLQNPLTKDELVDKFRQLAATVVSAEHAEEIIDAVYGLERIDDINKLGRLLVADKYR
jgi:2-methylcitrate dehydratase PrpD